MIHKYKNTYDVNIFFTYITIVSMIIMFSTSAVKADSIQDTPAFEQRTGAALVKSYELGGTARNSALIYVTGMARGLFFAPSKYRLCTSSDQLDPSFARKVIYTIGADDALKNTDLDTAIISATRRLWDCQE